MPPEVRRLAYLGGIPEAAAYEIMRYFADLNERVTLLEQALRAQAPTPTPRDYASRDH